VGFVDKTKRVVKGTPVLGPLLIRLYEAAYRFRPSYLGKYVLKPMVADFTIRRLRAWLPVPGLDIRRDATIVDTGIARFHWNPRDPYSMLGYPLRGNFEIEETRVACLLSKEAGTIVDVGGNFGWFTCHLLAGMPAGGTVHVFEPVPAMVEELTRNLALNARPDARVLVNNVCLSDREGEVSFFIPEKLGATFASLSLPKRYRNATEIKTRALTLDAYLAGAGVDRVDLIKIDVEGAELLVLKGAGKLLSSPRKPALLVEIQDSSTSAFGYTAQDVIRHILGFGYSAFVFPESGGLARMENDLPGDGYNYLFVHEASQRAVAEGYAVSHPARADRGK
jgi:FkbM family methyltransferase